MKKKGLIVATIVMVLVLAASLTTATYAWFTATATTTVEAIQFSVAAGSDVVIGIKANGVYNGDATQNDFYSNSTITEDGINWTGDIQGFGSSIDTGLDLGTITKAVGTGTIGTPNTVDATWNGGNTVIKANGAAASPTVSSAEAAVRNGYNTTNGDYLDVVLGVQPAKANVTSITLHLTINPTDTGTVLGMNSAIHCIYGIDQVAPTTPTASAYVSNAKSGEIDVYGTNHYGTTKATVNATTSTFAAQSISASTETLNAGWIDVPIVIAAAEGSNVLPVDQFYQIHLIIFIAGYDSDCLQSATGVGSTINLNFTAAKTE